jgi:hypothetical protein
MPYTRYEATLAPPLNIDVKAIVAFFHGYRYGAPYAGEPSVRPITSERIIDTTRNYRSVLTFDGNHDGQGFTKAESYVSPKELTYILSKLPQEQFQQIKTAFAGTALELQTPSTAELEELQKTDRQHNIDREMIAQINSLGQKQNTGKFTAAEARGILQAEMGFTNAESEKPILGTFGAAPCIAMAVYNPETKTAFLAHIDDLTDINSIEDLFYQLSADNRVTLEAHLAGGLEESRHKVTELINFIRLQKKC